MDFLQIGERLQHEEVPAAIQESLGLLAKCRFCFLDGRRSPGLDFDAERADGTGYPCPVTHCLPGQSRSFPIDLRDLFLEAKPLELVTIGAERIRFDGLGSG